MFRRQQARVEEDPIPEELFANIPVVEGKAGSRAEAKTEAEVSFTPTDEVIFAPAAAAPEAAAPGAGATSLAVAQQLRYELGEAFARELDRAEQAVATALAEMEGRLQACEAALTDAHAELRREREAREGAEARLKAFKELALK